MRRGFFFYTYIIESPTDTMHRSSKKKKNIILT